MANEKMWAGRAEKATSQAADDFNSSIRFDARMYRQDIEGSVQHAMMLAAKNIITAAECDVIVDGLLSIREDIESGALAAAMTVMGTSLISFITTLRHDVDMLMSEGGIKDE